MTMLALFGSQRHIWRLSSVFENNEVIYFA